MSGTFPIGEIARQTGIKVPTIRFYEQIGLLPAPQRSEGNRRCYRESDVRRLAFVRHARELGDYGIQKPRGMPGETEVTLYGGNAVIFDEYGHVKCNIGKSILDAARPEVQDRQSARVADLWNAARSSPARAKPGRSPKCTCAAGSRGMAR